MKIDKQKNKIRFFWKHKGQVKEDYLKIYKAILKQYGLRRNRRDNWMSVINTFVVYRQLSLIYDSFLKRKEYLFNVKWQKFQVWKNSKNTNNTIALCQDIRMLKTVITAKRYEYQLKQHLFKKRYQHIIGRLLVKFYTKTNLAFVLKRFAIKSLLKR